MAAHHRQPPGPAGLRVRGEAEQGRRGEGEGAGALVGLEGTERLLYTHGVDARREGVDGHRYLGFGMHELLR
ncbi:hypothetical protein ACFRCW_45410 [Streptomyces sp. NPDC056653]|uniref:hypothetical protein n=1 Tax=Streptomyces sp. NPDC056653 TaxID=3345894 RepID=UPI0036967C52